MSGDWSGLIFDVAEVLFRDYFDHGSLAASLLVCQNWNEMAKKVIEMLPDQKKAEAVDWAIAEEVDSWNVVKMNAEKWQYFEALLASGMDLNKGFGELILPLCQAAYLEQADVVEKLLLHGADVNVAQKKDHQHWVGWFGRIGLTPLHYAAYSNKGTKIIQILIDNGADVNKKTPTSTEEPGWTPLIAAVEASRGEGVGDSNAHAAVGALRAVKALLAHGADPNIVHAYSDDENLLPNNRAPLHFAVWNALGGTNKKVFLDIQMRVITLLLEHGANPNAIDTDDMTPLHYAAQRGMASVVVKVLVAYGADPQKIIPPIGWAERPKTAIDLAKDAKSSSGSKAWDEIIQILEGAANV